MVRLKTSVTLLVLSVTLGLSLAQSPSPGEPSISALIEELANRDYRRREAALKQLESRSPDDLPALRQALESTTDAEVRRRLTGLVERLERAAVLAPKQLNIVVKDRPVQEVIREIARQTGYSILYQGGANHTVSLNRPRATFWEVMDDLNRLTGATMYHNEGQGLIVYDQDGYWPHTILHGPFRIVANNFSYHKNLQLGPVPKNPLHDHTRSESLTFTFQLFSEPKLPIMGVGQPRLIEAIDDLGHSMKPAAAPHEVLYGGAAGGYRMFQTGSNVILNWPNKDAKTVKRLQIALPLTLLAEQKPLIIVDNILKAKDHKAAQGEVELVVHEVKDLNNAQYHVRMTVRNLAANAAQDFNWMNSVHQRIELHDAQGNKYMPQGFNWENSNPGNVQATFMFGNNGRADLGPPARLVYLHWSLMQHTIEFQFRDLPLP